MTCGEADPFLLPDRDVVGILPTVSSRLWSACQTLAAFYQKMAVDTAICDQSISYEEECSMYSGYGVHFCLSGIRTTTLTSKGALVQTIARVLLYLLLYSPVLNALVVTWICIICNTGERTALKSTSTCRHRGRSRTSQLQAKWQQKLTKSSRCFERELQRE